jgi:hypothetical protein
MKIGWVLYLKNEALRWVISLKIHTYDAESELYLGEEGGKMSKYLTLKKPVHRMG